MILYKYKSFQNLWHILDIALGQQVYCSGWRELNDPLEGKYEIYLGDQSTETEEGIKNKVEPARDELRIASFSKNPTNLLLWSHYADGHKGCAIELEINEDDPGLHKVEYHPFSSIIEAESETEMSMFHLFDSKSEEWSYEQEYRIITKETYYRLDNPVSRILLGPLVDKTQVRLLRLSLPETIDLVRTKLNSVQGRLEIDSATSNEPAKLAR